MSHEQRTIQLVEEHMAWSRTLATQALRRLPKSVDLDEAAAVALERLWIIAQRYRDDFQTLGFDRPVSFKAYARQKIYWAVLRAFSRRRWREDVHEPLDERMPAAVAIQQRQYFDMLLKMADDGLERRILTAHYQQEIPLRVIAAREGLHRYKVELAHRQLLGRLRERLEAAGVHAVADVVED